MKRAVVCALVLAGCDTRPVPPPPEPAASASASVAAPVRSAPFHSVSAVIASASAEPVPSALPGMPELDRACAVDADCDKTFFDIQCCSDCMPRLGNKASTKKIDAFCKDHKPASCAKPAPCGMVFGLPRCNGGKCVSR